MKDFKLTNLRNLSTEEQMRLNGGSNASCEVTCYCSCTCNCNNQNPSQSTDSESKDLGKKSTYGSKERGAMLKM